MSPSQASYDPVSDIPPLDAKIILVTGGNSGLGKQSALVLSKHNPSQIWIAARNAQTAQRTIKDIQDQTPDIDVKFLELDLSSFASIRRAAALFMESVPRLDILLLNAGVMACPPGLTEDGYEIQFGINHMGHALLCKLLLPLLLNTASSGLDPSPVPTDVRIVFVSSVAHKFTVSGGINFDLLKSMGAQVATNNRYGQSKLANLLYAQEMARRYRQLTIVSIHPGTVKTDLQKSNDGSLLMRGFQKLVVPFIGVTVQEGVKNQLWAATAQDVTSGEYYEPVGVSGKASALGKNRILATKLWDWTQQELDVSSV